MAEKRDLKRHRKRISIRFGIGEPNRVAFTEDISSSGMFIKTPNIVPPNSKIRIMFELGGDLKVDVEARVMWAKKVPQNMFHLVKKSGMGVRFLNFHAGEDYFKRYLEQIEAQS